MRCAIFIDGAYLSKVAYELGGRQPLDYPKLTQLMLPKGNDLLRVNYYDCHPYASKYPTPEELRMRKDKEKHFESISSQPRHEVRLGAIVRRGEDGSHTYHQKLIDTMISVDIVEQAVSKQVQTIVLVAGDSDFKPAIEAAKRHGILTILWSGPRHTVHDDLVELVDEHHRLTEAMLGKVRRAVKPEGGNIAEPLADTGRKPAPRVRKQAVKPRVSKTPTAEANHAPEHQGTGAKRWRKRRPTNNSGRG